MRDRSGLLVSTVDEATLLFAPPPCQGAPEGTYPAQRGLGPSARGHSPRYGKGVATVQPGALKVCSALGAGCLGRHRKCSPLAAPSTHGPTRRQPHWRLARPPAPSLAPSLAWSAKGRGYLVGEQLQTGPLEGVRQRKYKVGHPDFDVRGHLLTHLFRSTKDPQASLVVEAPAVPR